MQLTSILALGFPAVALAIGQFSLTKIIPWQPEDTIGVDGSAILDGIYYLADIQNALVHVIDVTAGKEVTRITGFNGPIFSNGEFVAGLSGPWGVQTIPSRNEIYVADGNGTLKVISASTNTIISTIHLPIPDFQADEMGYDSSQSILAVTAPDVSIPTLFFVSVTARQIVGSLSFPTAIQGLELPLWNPKDGNWYLSIPSTNANPGGEIAIIDPVTFKLIQTYPEPSCNSAGIVLGAPHSHTLFIGCNVPASNKDSYILSTTSGKVEHTVKDVIGVDQVAYSKNLNLFFASAFEQVDGKGNPNPELVVIDKQGKVVQRIKTDNVTAHAVSIDEKTNKLVVPLVKGIAIYDFQGDGDRDSDADDA